MSSGPASVVVAPSAEAAAAGPPSERMEIETRHGRFTVTMQGEPGPRKTACITFPDIALDSHACFGTLLHLSSQSARASESLFSRLVFYHIEPPGHADAWDGDAEALPWLEMDQLAEVRCALRPFPARLLLTPHRPYPCVFPPLRSSCTSASFARCRPLST